MLFLIGLGAFPGDGLKVLVKTGEIVETALVTELFDADTVVEQQLAGVPDTYFSEELGICFTGARFEVPAEGVGYQSCDGGHLVKIDRPGEMAEGVVIDGVDAVIFRLCEFVAKPDGR